MPLMPIMMLLMGMQISLVPKQSKHAYMRTDDDLMTSHAHTQRNAYNNA